MRNSDLLQGPVNSPTGEYTATAYYETYGGAVGGVNVWVDITYNRLHHTKKTIYYASGKSNFLIQWKNNTTLSITNESPDFPNQNRSIALEIGKEIYDESGAACSSLYMKKLYKTCYERDKN